jgi:hypothetical protein
VTVLDTVEIDRIDALLDTLPRHAWAHLREDSRTALRKYINAPIKAYGPAALTVEEQERISARKIKALFALYNVPEDWPTDAQWHWLALALAGDKFPGVRTLNHGFGGPSETKRDRRRKVVEKFAAYRRENPKGSRTAAANHFITKNKKECEAVRLDEATSLVQALSRASKK